MCIILWLKHNYFFPGGAQYPDCLSCVVDLRAWAGEKGLCLKQNSWFLPPIPCQVFPFRSLSYLSKWHSHSNLNPGSHPLSTTHIVFQQDWQTYSKLILNSSTFYHLSIASSLAQANFIFRQVRYGLEYLLSLHYYVIRPGHHHLYQDYLLPFLRPPSPLQCIVHAASRDLSSQSINLIITLPNLKSSKVFPKAIS